MERLTERDEFGNADIIALSDMMPEIYAELSFSETNALTDVLNRLAAYEDTMSIERAQELAQAEKDGRLVVLPCKAGESAYQWKAGDDIPSLFRFDSVNINEDGEIAYQTHWGETFTLDDFGKTVFLTRAEAEAALKKREEADNETD